MLEQKIETRADQDVAALRAQGAVPLARREEIVLRYWGNGELTPLAVANSLARNGSAVQFA